MNTDNKILVIAIAAAISLNTLPAADDISAILNQIQTESSGQKNTTIEKTLTSTPTTPSTPKKKKQTATTKKSDTQAKVAEKPAAPRIPVWGPTDKLPKNVTGQGVAGDFVCRGEDINGGIELIAASDASNPFARVFVVVNLTSDLPSGTFSPIGRRQLVRVPLNRPLIFIGKGILPGIYNVQAQ
jgi:hypothetical protein